MAVKNHTLDSKIIKAAKKEFLEKGYQKATLRVIAEKAGITTGALYTRYENKDVIFKSIIEKILKKISENFQPLKENYLKFTKDPTVDTLMNAIKMEEELYLDIMFRYYDECILFFCKSDGSSVELMIEKMMREKAEETVNFFHKIAKKKFDDNGIEFILSMQFYYYKQILQRGYDKEKAICCMKTVEQFLEKGWKDFFEQIL